ncbi:MAG: HDOD domain-containing protein [Ectothiorhodospiraceae bacterium]|nr:HDOD domain-containing protein [Ectothiorhodospiraceae bacterium]
MDDVFVARQPIFSRDLSVYGYELLFRAAGDSDSAEVISGNHATSTVILNAFTVVGLDKLVGRHKAFFNIDRAFLPAATSLPFPADRVVLELLEGTRPTPDVLEHLERLRRMGYVLSLDDYQHSADMEPFLSRVDIVKLEVHRLDDVALMERVAELRRFPVRLLAEKIENRERFELCRELGFDLFQGYFLSRPKTVRGNTIPASRLPTLRLLAMLHQSDVDLRELERIISSDVSLSYNLLRYLNSAFFPIQRRIESIHQAVIYLGIRELQSWASLIAMAAVGDKPSELMVTLIVRARMCQQLARKLGYPADNSYFTVGLFSGLDALMDSPMEKVLSSLRLSVEVERALLAREGSHGQLLDCVLRYEAGEWEQVEGSGIPAETLIETYLDALDWAREISLYW